MTTIDKIDKNFAPVKADDGLEWYDARDIGVGGRGWADTTSPFTRFPLRGRGSVIVNAWYFATHSSGLNVRFVTDAGKISVKWSLQSAELAMAHMPASGVSGVDIYARDRGRLRFVGNGEPSGKHNSLRVCAIPDDQNGREYCLYLPLYNGVTDLRIGLPPGAFLRPAPPWPGLSKTGKPILFYGTSITHGGCAARPGMNYTSIIGRMLDRPVINLGFSGNGTMYPELAPLLAEIDASVIVLDCIGNMSPVMARNNTEGFIRTLRRLRPGVPIVVPEMNQNENLIEGERDRGYTPHNRAVRAAFRKLLADGVPDLHLVPNDGRTGHDREATVDGIHPSDLGFMRMAETLAPVLAPLG